MMITPPGPVARRCGIDGHPGVGADHVQPAEGRDAFVQGGPDGRPVPDVGPAGEDPAVERLDLPDGQIGRAHV